jgi:electron transfer flavoprotein alpha subunit
MGIGRAENLLLVQKLASALRAAIGATRRVVDAGWLPRQTQIGLTGRSFAPKLYIAIGISGKSNHMVGIQRAGLILAINNDPQAEVFKQCDYGIVGDWAAITPILEKVLVEAQPAR